MSSKGSKLKKSSHLAIHIPAQNIAMFRFLLEAHDNLALFTVLERGPAILMLSYAAENHEEILNVLIQISDSIEFFWKDWPFME